MGSIISAISDDYEMYEHLCKMAGVKPVGIHSDKSFYDHAREIKKDLPEEFKEKHKNHYWYNCL